MSDLFGIPRRQGDDNRDPLSQPDSQQGDDLRKDQSAGQDHNMEQAHASNQAQTTSQVTEAWSDQIYQAKEVGCTPQGQPIVIQMPRQPASRAPWIILALIVLGIVLTMTSCFAVPLLAVKEIASAVNSQGNSSGGASNSLSDGASVAVMHWDNAISANSGVTPEKVKEALDKADKDPNIKAVVIRCNSPGGTVAASEEIASYIEGFDKPIVFSVADLCASGAYMGASQADYIMAMPTSDVGSIGVIMRTVNAAGLYEKLGVEMDAIKSAESKDAGASYRSLTDEERAFFQKRIDELNDRFIKMVADGRELTIDQVKPYATGQTYSGEEAKSAGLIDELGTFEKALAKAAELGGIGEDADFLVVSLDEVNPFDGLFPSFLGANSASREAFAREIAKGLVEGGQKGTEGEYQLMALPEGH